MERTGKPLSELAAGMRSIRRRCSMCAWKTAWIRPISTAIQAAVGGGGEELEDRGRVVLRASGTEPVIRVMVEGEDERQVLEIAQRLADVVAEAAA